MKPIDQFLGELLPLLCSAMGFVHDIYNRQLPFAPISGHRIFIRVTRVAVIVKCALIKIKAISFYMYTI